MRTFPKISREVTSGLMSTIYSFFKSKILPAILAGQIFVLSFASPSIAAQLSENELEIEKITNQILRKEIDLERYYLLYKVHGTKEPKYRRIRYYLLQVAASSCTLASNLMFLKLARDGMRNPPDTDFGRGDAHPGSSESDAEIEEEVATNTTAVPEDNGRNTVNYLRNAYVVSMLGILLDAGSSCIELSSNSLTAIKNIINKRSPGAAVKVVIERVEEIDKLIEERKKLVDTKPYSTAHTLHLAEEKVLLAFRNWCLSEFVDVYAEVKSSQAGNNLYYMLDLAADSVYLAGLVVGMRALKPGKEHLNGPSINVSIVGDAIAVASVPLSNKGSEQLYKFHQKRLLKKLQETFKDTEDDD